MGHHPVLDKLVLLKSLATAFGLALDALNGLLDVQ
jgi:hypothetical protein